jgi:hypothetical protein
LIWLGIGLWDSYRVSVEYWRGLAPCGDQAVPITIISNFTLAFGWLGFA